MQFYYDFADNKLENTLNTKSFEGVKHVFDDRRPNAIINK